MRLYTQKAFKEENSQTIIRTFVLYVLGAIALFLVITTALLYPQIRATLSGLQNQSDEASARTYASILRRYIAERETALVDIAQSPYVINAILLGQGERPDFRDFIAHVKLLGEDPSITVLDINGDVLYSEAPQAAEFNGAMTLIDGQSDHILDLDNTDSNPQFRLAIPIMYGNGREGVMIAQFSANPNKIYSDQSHSRGYSDLNAESGVFFEKGDQRIESDLASITQPLINTQYLEEYSITVAHITSQRAVILQRKIFIAKFLLSAGGAAIVTFALLIFFGRRLIVRPYLQLATTQQAIAKAVEGIGRINPYGHYLEVNHAYAAIAGYMPADLVGKDWSMTVHPDDLDYLNSAYQDMLKDGHVTAEARGIKKDGSIFHKRVTMISLYDEQGNFIGHHCFMTDITQRKKSEQEREKLISKLTNSNEELERFAFICSHDLQEPLRMIRSFSQRLESHLEDQLKDDNKGKRYLHFVADGAERAQDLIRDILSYSSVNSDTSNLEDVDLNDLLRVIHETMYTDRNPRASRVTWDKLPTLHGNKTQLYQLLQNLINNGLKYQDEEKAPHVHIGVADTDEKWKISVTDNGIGMDKKNLKKIFEIFQRLHRRTEFSGTGIGLSICKKVVERHGGTIWAESRPGEGSTFFFTVPKANPLTSNKPTLEINYDRFRKAS